MKTLLLLSALALLPVKGMADALVATTGTECAMVDGDDQGKPDLKEFNRQLGLRFKPGFSPELASVSVTPMGEKFLVCTTSKIVKKN